MLRLLTHCPKPPQTGHHTHHRCRRLGRHTLPPRPRPSPLNPQTPTGIAPDFARFMRCPPALNHVAFVFLILPRGSSFYIWTRTRVPFACPIPSSCCTWPSAPPPGQRGQVEGAIRRQDTARPRLLAPHPAFFPLLAPAPYLRQDRTPLNCS